ncbi:hypothetical protein CO676_30500 [Sinorhizobium sp. BJ1]|nr:hypothetical protein CO676_30500 [Sinorhizobium sp. BJ1]
MIAHGSAAVQAARIIAAAAREREESNISTQTSDSPPVAEQQVGEWQPIESAPAVGRKRLLFFTKTRIVVAGYRIAKTRLVVSDFGRQIPATHWQHLPAPPSPTATP